MKKFNPEKELSKIQGNNFNKQSNFKGMFLPLLVIGSSLLAITAASFSANIVGKTPIHTIELEVLNGPVDFYSKEVGNGPFKDQIKTDATFGSIKCSEGDLYYDVSTGTISNNDVRGNIRCVLSFIDDGSRVISLAELNSINDNSGTSYYFKGDSTNNYLELGDDIFRIIRINGDGSLRIMLEDSIKTTSLTEELITELTNWSTKYEKYNIKLVKEDFDVSNYTLAEMKLNTLVPALGEYYGVAGLLNVKEAMLINSNVDTSFLEGNMLLANYSDIDKVWVINENGIESVEKDTKMNVKPVLNIKVGTLKGQGTKGNPYTV